MIETALLHGKTMLAEKKYQHAAYFLDIAYKLTENKEIQQVLDEVIFMRYGQLVLYTSVDNIREEKGKSVDAYFREVFAC